MIKSIFPLEAKNLIDENKSLKLIDVREPWEHSIAKLHNSVLIPLREFQKHIDSFTKSDTFLIYCHHGIRSFYACDYMIQQGFKNVYNLKGGIDAWSREIDRTINKY